MRTTPRGIASVVVLLVVAIAASGCGSSAKASPHDAYVKRVSSACDDMRAQIEKLGKPGDTPLAKVYPPSVRIGRAFVRELRQLHPPAADAQNAKIMVTQFGYYFDGLALGYAVLTKRKSQQGFVQTVTGALQNLKLAEAAARKLDATACARRPFT
jgi:hypothetical protein